jgi:hypothetical protein
VAIANAVSEGRLQVVPDVLVTGGGAVDGLAATLMRAMNGKQPSASHDRRRRPVAGAVRTRKQEPAAKRPQ